MTLNLTHKTKKQQRSASVWQSIQWIVIISVYLNELLVVGTRVSGSDSVCVSDILQLIIAVAVNGICYLTVVEVDTD